MFDGIDLKDLKEKHKMDVTKSSKKKSIKDLNDFLNPYDYKEFIPLYLPSKESEVKIIVKPLPFVDNERKKVSRISIPFSKHLSKDIKQNCRKNIDEDCPICETSSIKKFDFIIFPVYIISNSSTEYYKQTIRLIEVPLYDWEKSIEPNLEKFYKGNYVLVIHLKRDKPYYKTTYKIEEIEIPHLTEEMVFNKCFMYEKTRDNLYNEKAYLEEFSLETKKHEIIITEVPF